jgi:serine/threonine protein phosphatase 1
MNEKAKIYVTTDSHGCNKELQEVLQLGGFNFNRDTLIHIGDCTDRGPDSYGVIETLLSIRNLISIQGNHDYYMKHFIETGYHPWKHGSYKTVISYIDALELTYEEVSFVQKPGGVSTNFKPHHIPKSHRNFFLNQIPYYIDSQNRLFVHGGYDPLEVIEIQSSDSLTWDRELVERQAEYLEQGIEAPHYYDVNEFKRIFVGHTPTIVFKNRLNSNTLDADWLPYGTPFTKPMYMGQLVDIDTGCCFGGKLSLIDITDEDNHILYQSS